MTATNRFRVGRLRMLAVLGALAMAVALLPATALAQDPADQCPQQAPESDFTDRDQIPDAHRSNVDCAAHLGIVRGFEDSTYRPRGQVRRDQMASFIALTLDAAGVNLPAGEQDTFTDVDEGSVHADNINRLAAAGIVEGGPLNLPDNEYGPALRTRRDQMASFLMRAAGFALHGDVEAFDSATQAFGDVPSGNVHFEKVNAAAEHAIAQGVGDTSYAPRVETRRDQMASFVVRLLTFIMAEEPQVEEYTVPLSWINEVDDSDPANPVFRQGEEGATGTAELSVAADGSFTYEVSWDGLTPPFCNAPGMHIHSGGIDENGPIEITLATCEELDEAVADGSNTVTGAFNQDRVPEGQYGTTEELAEAILANPENFYVNLHTADFPPGAIRGQLPDGGQDQIPAP